MAALAVALATGSAAIAAGDPGTSRGDPVRGVALFRQYCAVCHGATGGGDGPNAAALEDDRPRDLTDARYMRRLTDRQLVEVIRGGGGAVGRSRFMPAWGATLSERQIADLVAYTRGLSTGRPPSTRAAADSPKAAGARLVAELGCTACHRIGDLAAAPVAPDLDHLGAKVQRAWLEAYLRRPHRIRPTGYVPLSRGRMPDFQLAAEESRGLASYLARRRPADEAAAEDAVGRAAAEGNTLFQKLACRACHVFGGRGGQAGPDLSMVAQRLQAPWVARYLLNPQAVDPRSPMPRPGIGPEEAWALAAYLLEGAPAFAAGSTAASDEREAVARGAALFRDLACRACHRRADEGAPDRVGPDLTFVGDKLRPEWLAGFLRQPHTVRPWLRARMPTFGLAHAEVAQVTAFLAGLRDRRQPPLPPRLRAARGAVTPNAVRAGARLASREYLSCSSCHLGGDRPPEGLPQEWAPDLRLAGRRLRPEWIVRWLLDPQRIQPGTKMPSFFADPDSGPDDIFGGDEERQILALRDYLLAMDAVPAEGRQRP